MVTNNPVPIRSYPSGDVRIRVHRQESLAGGGQKMVIEKDLADFLHRIIDHLPSRENEKADLHTELAVNTTAATGEDKTDAAE